MIRLTPQQKNYVTAQATTVKLHMQERFLRSVARILESCPQPVSLNDTIRACQLSLEVIPAADVIISRCVGDTNDEDDLRKRYYWQQRRIT
jgi:hypothetical protein